MTKFQLNNKLSELYKIKNCLYGDANSPDILLIDDWNRLMDLAVDNKLNIYFSLDVVTCTNNKDVIESNEFMSDHESPQAATRFAIAMALVKLKEV